MAAKRGARRLSQPVAGAARVTAGEARFRLISHVARPVPNSVLGYGMNYQIPPRTDTTLSAMEILGGQNRRPGAKLLTPTGWFAVLAIVAVAAGAALALRSPRIH